MPCYGPLVAYYGAHVNPETGKRALVFDERKAWSPTPVKLPCGRCIGCKLERSRQWAMRCLHEMKENTGSGSAFLTMTYEDSMLPPRGSLVKRDLQLFMKRLRKRRPPGLRFYGCGEYGEMTLRPHYHVLLLNTFFSDMKKMSWGLNDPGPQEKYVSAELAMLWPYGQSVIGSVTFESCAYVARYCTKVISDPDCERHEMCRCRRCIHYRGREAEFAVMSRNPGIGLAWFNKYNGEWYAHDSAVIDEREVPLSRYYDAKYELLDAKRLALIKKRRRRSVNRADNTPARLRVREELTVKTMAHFKRGTENGL